MWWFKLVFNPLYFPIKSLLLVAKCAFEHKDLQTVGLKLNKYV